MKKFFRKGISLLLAALLSMSILLPACAESVSTEWVYTFIPGEALEGEGTKVVSELLNALQLRITRQTDGADMQFLLEVLSEGNIAFTVTAQDNDMEEFGLQCSLMGNHVLLCQRDQIPSFLLTLVQVLADRGILKGESLERVNALAQKAGNMLRNLASAYAEAPAETGIDFSPFLRKMQEASTSYERTELNGQDPECPGAVAVHIYHLSEADLNTLVEMVLGKLCAVPVLSEALNDGSLHIGQQVITAAYIRELFASMHGETVLRHYEDADGRILRLWLQTPDISALTSDPDFARVSGVDITITRTDNGDGTSSSLTRASLSGLDRSVMDVRLDKGPGRELSPMPMKKTHQVGEMNSTELFELIRSMGLLLARNAVNMVLVLPRCVFDLLIGKLF